MFKFKLQRYSKGRKRWVDFGGAFEDTDEKKAKQKATDEKMKLTVRYASHFDGPMKFRIRKVMK